MEGRDDRGNETTVRFAVIGDCEPKPDPVFEWLGRAVAAIDRHHADSPFDFVAGIGDVPHEGTREQYEAATEHLRDLEPVFHPIMGNEEQRASTDRFLRFARRWSDDPDAVPDVQYVKQYGGYRFLFASPLVDGRDVTDEQLDWFADQLDHSSDRSTVGFIHAAPARALPTGRSMADRRFERVLDHPALALLFHGHSHIAVHEHPHVGRDEFGVAHVHVPGIERTKIGTTHVPRFPVVRIDEGGTVRVRSYNVEAERFEPALQETFELPSPSGGR